MPDASPAPAPSVGSASSSLVSRVTFVSEALGVSRADASSLCRSASRILESAGVEWTELVTTVVLAPSILHSSVYLSAGVPVGDALAYGLHRFVCCVRRGNGAVVLCVESDSRAPAAAPLSAASTGGGTGPRHAGAGASPPLDLGGAATGAFVAQAAMPHSNESVDVRHVPCAELSLEPHDSCAHDVRAEVVRVQTDGLTDGEDLGGLDITHSHLERRTHPSVASSTEGPRSSHSASVEQADVAFHITSPLSHSTRSSHSLEEAVAPLTATQPLHGEDGTRTSRRCSQEILIPARGGGGGREPAPSLAPHATLTADSTGSPDIARHAPANPKANAGVKQKCGVERKENPAGDLKVNGSHTQFRLESADVTCASTQSSPAPISPSVAAGSAELRASPLSFDAATSVVGALNNGVDAGRIGSDETMASVDASFDVDAASLTVERGGSLRSGSDVVTEDGVEAVQVESDGPTEAVDTSVLGTAVHTGAPHVGVSEESAVSVVMTVVTDAGGIETKDEDARASADAVDMSVGGEDVEPVGALAPVGSADTLPLVDVAERTDRAFGTPALHRGNEHCGGVVGSLPTSPDSVGQRERIGGDTCSAESCGSTACGLTVLGSTPPAAEHASYDGVYLPVRGDTQILPNHKCWCVDSPSSEVNPKGSSADCRALPTSSLSSSSSNESEDLRCTNLTGTAPQPCREHACVVDVVDRLDVRVEGTVADKASLKY